MLKAETLEQRWEREVDEMFLDPTKDKGQFVEKHWKNYLTYFNLYFQSHIKKDNSKTLLLDIGCGPGYALGELQKHGFQLYGSDFSTKMIEYAKTLYPKILFQQSSVYLMPFADETFDIIVCLGVFQTITEQEKAIAEMRRVLKKGGTLIIRTLNKLSLSSVKAQHLNPDYRFYNPFAFAQQLRDNGFAIRGLKGIYLMPQKFNFLFDVVVVSKLYALFNALFFPLFVFLSHSFYCEAKKL